MVVLMISGNIVMMVIATCSYYYTGDSHNSDGNGNGEMVGSANNIRNRKNEVTIIVLVWYSY